MFRGLELLFESAFPPLLLWLRLPAFISWAGVSAGIAVASLFPFSFCSQIVQTPLSRHLLLISALLFAALGILLRRAALRFSLFLAFAILLCLSHRAREVEVFDAFRSAQDQLPSLVFIGQVTSPPLPWQEKYRFLLKIDSVPGVTCKALRGRTVECLSTVKPRQYRCVRVMGSFEPPGIRRNPFEFDRFASKMAQGVWGSFDAAACSGVEAGTLSLPERLFTEARNLTLEALDRITDYDDRALLQAAILGDTGFLSPYVNDIFRKAGTYHLIAISGLNVAMLTSALFFLLRLLRVRRMASMAVCIAAIWAYLPFVGMIPSLFRATVMATVVLAALLFEKKQYALQALGLAGAIWLVLSPESLFLPGYQLTFATTGALIIFVPFLSRFIPRPQPAALAWCSTFFFGSLYVSLASFLASLPILLYHFGMISWFGMAANIVAVSTMTVSLWAFLAGAVMQAFLPLFAIVPLWISERCMDLVVLTAKWSLLFPFSRVTAACPPMELIALFSLIIIGMAAIRPERLRIFLLLALAGAAIFIPFDLALLHGRHATEVVRFVLPKSTVLGIRWPDHRVLVISPRATPGLPQALAMHVVPWVRHACSNRIDALVVPEHAREMIEAQFRNLPLPVAATIYAGSFRAKEPRLMPAAAIPPGCRCEMSDSGAKLLVHVASPDFDTVVALPAAGYENASAHLVDYGDLDLQSAAIFRPSRTGIGVRAVVAPDHPVR